VAGDALTLDAAQAAGIIRRQFPPLATRSVQGLGEGSDHWAFEVDGQWVFRFPKHPGGGETLLSEARLLGWLAPHLPLPAPVPLFIGQPSPLFPEAFTGAAKLEGTTGLAGPNPDLAGVGHSLGRFLRILHAQDTAEAQRLGLGLDFDPTFADWQDDALADAAAIADAGHLPDAEQWRGVLGQSPASPPQRFVVLHADLAAEHVLLGEGGEITGILDWADSALGDPARDLAGLIGWGGRTMLDAALSEYRTVDAGCVRRAVWYAACRAVGDIAFGTGQDRPTYVQAGKRALTLLHTDFAVELAGGR
jgi:aminoglycoside phosphotransferase (APT) family kinase protein